MSSWLGKGDGQTKGGASDQALVLQTRLANLSAELAARPEDDSLAQEFIRTSRELQALRARNSR
ncbi:MAG: hypothetical protein Q8P50_05080 [Bacillota bacterium]|nr:hypothetical protein [Bacillota bacterium]